MLQAQSLISKHRTSRLNLRQGPIDHRSRKAPCVRSATRRNGSYSLTYDDSNLPSHYGWKNEPNLEKLEDMYREVKESGRLPIDRPERNKLASRVQKVLESLDQESRWITIYGGERLVGQPKFRDGDPYLSSEVFSHHLELLSQYLLAP